MSDGNRKATETLIAAYLAKLGIEDKEFFIVFKHGEAYRLVPSTLSPVNRVP